MSLLMDALKRAEKARQAGEADASSDPEATQGLTLDPLRASTGRADRGGESGDGMPGEAPPDARGAPGPQIPADADPLDSLSLEPRDESGVYELPEPSQEGSADFGNTGDSQTFVLGDEGGLPIEDTSATLPSLKAARASVDDYFDGTRSVSMSMDAVRAALDDDTVATDADMVDTGEQRTAARAMLDKGAGARRGSRWVALALIPLLLLVLVAVGGYMFSDQIQRLLFGGPSVVLGPGTRQPGPRPADPPVATAAAPATAPAVSVVAPAPEPSGTPDLAGAARAPAPVPGLTDPIAPASGTAAAPPGTATPVVAAPVDAAGPGATPGVAAGGVTTAAASPPAASTPAVPGADTAASGDSLSGEFTAAPRVEDVLAPLPSTTSPASGVGRRAAGAGRGADPVMARLQNALGGTSRSGGDISPITIKRNAVSGRVHPQISRGYEAFQAGDLHAAQHAYARALRARPRSRDAILGLAAVAMAEGNWAGAQARYLDLLAVDPRDSVALAALISLQQNVDPVASESRIKSLLTQEPNAAYLHFSLGNVFARQLRWAEAQQAYFDAFRLENGNADYAFNLAVSLDQLIQPVTAGQYYRRALELADSSHASFASAAVRQRLRALGGQE